MFSKFEIFELTHELKWFCTFFSGDTLLEAVRCQIINNVKSRDSGLWPTYCITVLLKLCLFNVKRYKATLFHHSAEYSWSSILTIFIVLSILFVVCFGLFCTKAYYIITGKCILSDSFFTSFSTLLQCSVTYSTTTGFTQRCRFL